MKLNILKSALFIIVLLVLLTPSSGCNIFSPIIGKWQDNDTNEIYEFTRSGDYIITYSWGYVSGKYELIGDNTIKFLAPDNIAYDTRQYSISGDIMTLRYSGETHTLSRYDSTKSTTITSSTISSQSLWLFGISNIYVISITEQSILYYINITLAASVNTEPNTNYTIKLYENEQYRATSILSTDSIVSPSTSYTVSFPCSAEEYQKYNQQTDLSRIFSVQIIQNK